MFFTGLQSDGHRTFKNPEHLRLNLRLLFARLHLTTPGFSIKVFLHGPLTCSFHPPEFCIMNKIYLVRDGYQIDHKCRLMLKPRGVQNSLWAHCLTCDLNMIPQSQIQQMRNFENVLVAQNTIILWFQISFAALWPCKLVFIHLVPDSISRLIWSTKSICFCAWTIWFACFMSCSWHNKDFM